MTTEIYKKLANESKRR